MSSLLAKRRFRRLIEPRACPGIRRVLQQERAGRPRTGTNPGEVDCRNHEIKTFEQVLSQKPTDGSSCARRPPNEAGPKEPIGSHCPNDLPRPAARERRLS